MKTLKIENETHKLLKEFGNANSIKIGSWVDKLIRKELEKIYGQVRLVNRNMD